jgi:hypothetical protein
MGEIQIKGTAYRSPGLLDHVKHFIVDDFAEDQLLVPLIRLQMWT